MVSSYGEGVTVILDDAAGGISFSDSKLDVDQRSLVLRFLDTKTHFGPVYSGDRFIAAKDQSGDGSLLVCVAVLTDELTAESSSLRYGTISIIVASIFLLGALLVLVARDINQSTKKLVAGLKDVEGGSFDHEVNIYSTGRILDDRQRFQPDDCRTARKKFHQGYVWEVCLLQR